MSINSNIFSPRYHRGSADEFSPNPSANASVVRRARTWITQSFFSLIGLTGYTMGNYRFRVETFGGDDAQMQDHTEGDPYDPQGDVDTDNTGSMFAAVMIGVLSATAFGLIHIAAWKYPFPFHSQEKIWHVSALIVTCAPITILPVTICLVCCFSCIELNVLTMPVFGLLYVIARFMMIVIMFSSLRSLPSSAYDTIPWTELIPHLR